MSPSREAPRYEIRTIADFLKVPADRRAACIAELPKCLEYMEAFNNLLNACTPDDDAKARAEAYIWIDDGEAKLRHITVNAGGKEVLRMQVNYIGDKPNQPPAEGASDTTVS